jgi:subtilisin family serine protease
VALAGATQLVACGSELDPFDGGDAPEPDPPIATQTQGVVAANVPPAPTSPGAADAPKAITLVTGDRVFVRGPNLETVSVVRGPGRDRIHFAIQRLSDAAGRAAHLYVIPDDAIPLLARDQVDRRLFDVTQLIEFEYDDAHRADLPLIVTYAPSAQRQAFSAGARSVPGAAVQSDLSIIHGMSVVSPKARTRELWGAVAGQASAARGSSLSTGATEPIAKVWLDGLRRPVLDRSVPEIGAPAAWDLGYEGRGVFVAVLDTGVDATHPDLSAAVVRSRNFTTGLEVDEVGHGTHVASIIAGSGAAEGGRYRGVAPAASLLSGKVCEVFGCQESSIIAGMQWAVIEEGARLVNLSLGGFDTPDVDPVEAAVNALSAEFGALFVVAAGNIGPSPYSLASPASADLSLAVGAVDRAGDVAELSSRGLRLGDHAVKPDLAAPGVDIVAARAAGTELGPPVGDAYVALSGTSMAAPHVAGAAALLLEQHPEWGAVELKAALMGSAHFNPTWSVPDQGAGCVDVEAALGTSLLADPPSTSFGLAPWPHDDDEPIERTVTYRNLGGATELRFELDVVGPGGIRPPAEMFKITPATLQLPAGGTGSVTLTANTSVATPDGVYSGRLIGSDGSRTVASPLAVTRELESYDLTLRFIDRDGPPADGYLTTLVGLDQPVLELLFGLADGTDVTLHLPPGRYAIDQRFFGYDLPEPVPATVIVLPNEQLTEDRILTIDGRVAQPVTLTAPKRTAAFLSANLTWHVSGTAQSPYAAHFFADTQPLYYGATVGTTPPDFGSQLHGQWTDATEEPAALYAAAWTRRSGLPQEPLAPITRRKLAVVHANYAAPSPSSEFENLINVYVGDGTPVYFGPGIYTALPVRRTEYYFSDDGTARWLNEFWMNDAFFTKYLVLGWIPRSYRAGRTYDSPWNQPVFSALLPEESLLPWPAAHRSGDVITVLPFMYSDGGGHGGRIAEVGRTVLYRNGEPIGQWGAASGFFEVPPEPAEYRLELDHSQSLFELSTRQRIVWSFQSAHVAEGEERLPLLVVRFNPELDERGRAPRGRNFHLPFSVQQFGLGDTPRVQKPVLEVSYDDGATWARAHVERDGRNWQAELDHPGRAEYVSLRASTRNDHGNAVEQTLIRAYALARRPGRD